SKQTLNSNNIQLLPNPTNDILVLQSNETENYSVEIYDIMGQLIAKTNINANENISVGHLKRGLYIFKIFNQNELVQIQKIVLQ
ncbi:MAG: T9SS type A sorting domain-containing protein, partial [Bacteroidales bacterium]|nr:T9SS type A sorting domain-containing protein [Bacteroidales bacterium]